MKMQKIKWILPKSKEEIQNTGRVERVFKLVRFLQGYKTISECANHIQVHKKSFHRYINLLTQLGFRVEILKGYRNQYGITNLKEYFKDGNKV